MSVFLLGVDGGGSATQAIVADHSGRVLGEGLASGCCTYQIGGVEQCREILRLSISRAISSAGLKPEEISFAVLGLSGADSAEDYRLLSGVVSELRLLPRFEIVNDTFIALRSGTTTPYGVCVVCGTGANAAAIDQRGNRWAFGEFCDWGGGLSLGKEALRAVLRSVDGRAQQTTLLNPLLAALGYGDVHVLLQHLWANHLDLSKLSRLAPIVFDASNAGDETASALLNRMGREMALYATTLIRRFRMQQLAVEVVIVGGLFSDAKSALNRTFEEDVLRVAASARIVRPSLPAAAGALLMAADIERVYASPQIHDNFRNSCQRLVGNKTQKQPSNVADPQFKFPFLY